MTFRLPRLAVRQTDYWVTVLKRTWRGSVFTSFLMPFLYLTAMGVGLGSFVDTHSGERALGGVSYLAFIAPGLLATTAMQLGVGEATWPVMGGFKWHRFYFSMAATPLSPEDIVLGQLVFIAFRIFSSCAVFLLVMAAYGALHDVLGAIVALLVVVLLGLAYAAPIVGVSARLKSESGFSLIYRLGVVPMFLFSGAFFPISQLPAQVVWLAYVTPIWHGVDLARMLALGQIHVWA
ncbi:MAG: ABC transporter permease, partial [Actinomycetota bacterium]|nr:ABC transporter permease [Actinomycetota bacterium]